jgi:prolyl 4-hydroxylase
VTAILDQQRILVVDDFLDAPTCRQVNTELRFTWWQPSTVANRNALGDVVTFRSRKRTSWSAQQEYFSAQLIELLDDIERRVSESYRLDRAFLEPWQAVRYEIGGQFDLHHDAGLFADEEAGERVTTVLIYLHSPVEGGGTQFPDLGHTTGARAGRLMLWRNLTPDGHIDERMRHRALPLLSGQKAILTTWERQRSTNRRTTPSLEVAHGSRR